LLAPAHAREAGRNIVARVALEAVAQEHLRPGAPRPVELQPGALRADVELLAFVDVQRLEIEAGARIAVGRALRAREDADAAAFPRLRTDIGVGAGRRPGGAKDKGERDD
jgi:hypothetical protein